ncbi:MAG: tetratricopeptide repeat protein [Kofleriaceae bacterium]
MGKALCVAIVLGLAGTAAAKGGAKIPISTKSNEARELFIKGRDLNEKLRATDGRKLFEQALEKDKDFAMAYVGLATTAGTTKEFFDAVEHAVTLAPKTTEAEQLVIRGLEAGGRGDLAHQKEYYTKLTKQFPDDERAQMLLGGMYFGQQDYPNAIKYFEAAIKIDATFTAPYNQLGYAYRFTDKLADAEKTFKKYIELIPNDPNPYDSYGELLMKTGRFDDSIKNYEKALAIDSHFIASYVGIGNNQMFLGKFDAARASFAKLSAAARADGERRQAVFWTAAAYVAQGDWNKAGVEADKLVEWSKKSGDLGQLANDLAFMGNLLLESGKADAAATTFKQQLETVEKAGIPADNKATAKRTAIYNQGRIALAKKDLKAAKALSADYAKALTAKANPFEVRQQHELAGAIALAEKNFKVATGELAKANQQDPRILYMQALALEGAGDKPTARAMAVKAGDFNALNFNYAFIRGPAQALATKLK